MGAGTATGSARTADSRRVVRRRVTATDGGGVATRGRSLTGTRADQAERDRERFRGRIEKLDLTLTIGDSPGLPNQAETVAPSPFRDLACLHHFHPPAVLRRRTLEKSWLAG